MDRKEDITQLLEAAAGGDQGALDRLFPLVYDELRGIAYRRLHAERRGHTLDATGLVHEAYLKLIQLDRIDWQSRGHFFAIAARAMRNILVDYAVRRKAVKRGGDRQKVSLDASFPFDENLMTDTQVEELLSLDQALKHLETHDPRQSKIVECRFFGDYTIDETAAALGISPATVSREWSMARAWLNKTLADPDDAS